MKTTALPVAPRSTAENSSDLALPDGAVGAAEFTINVESVEGDNPRLAVIIEGRKTPLGEYVAIERSPDITIPGKTRIVIAPDTRAMSMAAERKVSRPMPPLFRVRCEVSGTFKFAVGVTVI